MGQFLAFSGSVSHSSSSNFCSFTDTESRVVLLFSKSSSDFSWVDAGTTEGTGDTEFEPGTTVTVAESFSASELLILPRAIRTRGGEVGPSRVSQKSSQLYIIFVIPEQLEKTTENLRTFHLGNEGHPGTSSIVSTDDTKESELESCEGHRTYIKSMWALCHVLTGLKSARAMELKLLTPPLWARSDFETREREYTVRSVWATWIMQDQLQIHRVGGLLKVERICVILGTHFEGMVSKFRGSDKMSGTPAQGCVRIDLSWGNTRLES